MVFYLFAFSKISNTKPKTHTRVVDSIQSRQSEKRRRELVFCSRKRNTDNTWLLTKMRMRTRGGKKRIGRSPALELETQDVQDTQIFFRGILGLRELEGMYPGTVYTFTRLDRVATLARSTSTARASTHPINTTIGSHPNIQDTTIFFKTSKGIPVSRGVFVHIMIPFLDHLFVHQRIQLGLGFGRSARRFVLGNQRFPFGDPRALEEHTRVDLFGRRIHARRRCRNRRNRRGKRWRCGRGRRRR